MEPPRTPRRRLGARDTAWYSIVDHEWPAVRARLEELLARPHQTS